MERKNIAITVVVGLIVIALLIGCGYWAIRYYGGSRAPVENTEQNSTDTTSQNTDSNPKVDNGAKDNTLPAGYATLDKSQSRYTATQDVQYTKAFNERVVMIQSKPTSVLAWLELGNIKYGYFDNRGAEEAWLYAVKLAPSYVPTHVNLAEFYWHRVNDYAKAEEQMMIVLKNEPTNVPTYRNLSDLYRYNLTAKSALADDVLKDAYAKLPTEHDLLAHLAYYYVEEKDWANAVTYLKQLAEARPTDTQVASDLSSARQSLANQ